MEWIAAKRPPDIGARVIVIAEIEGVVGAPFIATYQGGDAWEDDSGEFEFTPLCWMPLPDSPSDPRSVQ